MGKCREGVFGGEARRAWRGQSCSVPDAGTSSSTRATYIDGVNRPLRKLLRTLALTVATIQIVGVALAPALESAYAHGVVGVPAIAAEGAPTSSVGHQPELCAACQILSATARRAEQPAVVVPTERLIAQFRFVTRRVTTPDFRHGFLSRAPPVLLT